MKILKSIVFLSLSSALSFTAFAASNGSSPNGKPFQKLNELIEQNATAIDANGDLIDQNSVAILALSTELGTLDGRVGVLEIDVLGLTTRFGTLETTVANNTSDITLAFAKITSVQSDLSNLDTVVAANTQAITDAETAIAATEADIAQLDTDLNALYNTVAVNTSAITGVQVDITAAETRLTQLEADVVTNAAEIQTAKDDINDLYASQSSLQAIVDSNTMKITQIESDFFGAQNDIATLYGQYNDLLAVVGANADTSDGAIAALKAELLVLIAATEVDIANNKADLTTLNQDLLLMAQGNSAIAQDLRDQMLALALLVDSNSTSITALQTQVGALSGNLTTLNAQYNSLSSLYGQLSAHVDDHHDELAALVLALDSLGVRVGALEELNNPSVETLTLTDNPGVPDNHIPALQAFFTTNFSLGRWVGAVGATTALNRFTEYCAFDATGVFSRVYTDTSSGFSTENVTGTIKLNGGTRYNGQLSVRRNFDSVAGFTYLDIASQVGINAQLHVIDYSLFNQTYDIYNTGWYSFNSNSPVTTATYVIADDRLTACGY